MRHFIVIALLVCTGSLIAAESEQPASATSAAVDTTQNATAAAPPSKPADANLFLHTFESGDRSHTTAELNRGVSWTDFRAMSLVRSDGFIVQGTSGGRTEDGGFEARKWENAPDGTSGRHALRARHDGRGGFPEIRWRLDTAVSEVWVREWRRVPLNFSYPPDAGGTSSGPRSGWTPTAAPPTPTWCGR
ncbi:MAG: hypothetical protein WD042_17100 [Phycisphaeraceae bacterium]